jgi:ADP-dependent NAD(P)H-hydrate dehydratase / NAD(P)H-hydrate epimerase
MQAAAAHSRCPLLSLDCPSGLDCETGRTLGACVIATHTISFLGLKPGLLTGDGPDLCGKLRNDALQLTPAEFEAALAGAPPGDRGETIGHDNLADALHRRRANCHKGSFGSAGIFGGAAGMLGAALLAGRAALHLGVGRTYLGLLDPQAPPVDPLQPELMLRVGSEAALQLLDPTLTQLTALAVGPGLGRSTAAHGWLGRTLTSPLPLVLDADALNLLAQDDDLKTQLAARPAPTVLTPHPAEAARLLAVSVNEVQRDRMAAAASLAAMFKAWVVLKGNGSIVAAPNGQWWINTNGNPGLATAGTGDVLTGFLVALVAQGYETGLAARAAVHLHAAAADDWAIEQGGEVGLAAAELVPLARRRFNAWIEAERRRRPSCDDAGSDSR